MIEELTKEQEQIIDAVAQEYEDYVLSGDDSYNVDEIEKGIAFIYSLCDLKPPEIVVCDSPLEMKRSSGIGENETFDNLGCGYDSGWTAFYDAMERIGVEYDEEFKFTQWKNFILKSGVFATILFEDIAYVCIRPCLVKRNSNYDMHCETGPAIAWKDGYCEYFLNGVVVDEHLVMTPAEQLDPKLVLKEENAEVRREIVRKIGIERVCEKLEAKVVDKKGDYELLNLDIIDGTYRPYLKMKNPSIGVYHIEGVHPDCLTVEGALKWRNGTDEKPVSLS